MKNNIPGLGHNSEGSDELENAAAKELLSFVERWERLDEEKKAIASDQKDVMGEAKSRGYDTTAIRDLIRERKQDENERIERETILETYREALARAGVPIPKGK